jgi:6 kDa early secretory antigenic target
MSNDGTISVTYASLNSASSSIASSATTIEQHLDYIKKHVDRVAADWDGDAKEQYAVVQAQWNTSAENMHTTLLKISKAVEQAAEHYQSTDKQAAGRWGA